MQLYFPVDLTGNLIMIEKLVSGGTWTEDLRSSARRANLCTIMKDCLPILTYYIYLGFYLLAVLLRLSYICCHLSIPDNCLPWLRGRDRRQTL